ncbi:MAG: histidinol-phosphatase HisJ family protein [Coriobacteriia bacterium]
MIDLHIHTARCGHATGSVEEYVRAAAVAGVDTIAFTDHLPLPGALLAADPAAAHYAMAADELPLYVEEVLDAKSRAARSGGPEVLLGIEADLHRGNEEHVRALLGSFPFDIVLGSVHYVDEWAFDDPARVDGYASWDLMELWERYFDDLALAAASGLADVIGHADLVKKFCFVPGGDLTPLYARAAAAFADAGCVVEVNAAGLRKPCKELYPSDAFLRELARRGVRVTIGSDAHSPSDVGAGFAEARAALVRAGYQRIVVFRDRVAQEVSL